MNFKSQDKGKKAEAIAIQHLKNLGYRILATNYRTPLAEIDIIALDKKSLVVVEVKSGNLDFSPATKVNQKKRTRILKALDFYLYQNRISHQNIRLEVISIIIPGWQVQHFTEEFFDGT